MRLYRFVGRRHDRTRPSDVVGGRESCEHELILLDERHLLEVHVVEADEVVEQRVDVPSLRQISVDPALKH